MPSLSDRVRQWLYRIKEGLARAFAWSRFPMLAYTLWWAIQRIADRGG